MDNSEQWFNENSRKIIDFSDTNEEVISKEKFIEFAEMQASKTYSNAVLTEGLPSENCPKCGKECYGRSCHDCQKYW